MDTRVAAGGTLIRRYALALTPAGAGIEAAVTAASVPPLSGGPDIQGSAAAHAFTIADSVGGTSSQPAAIELEPNVSRACRSHHVTISPERVMPAAREASKIAESARLAVVEPERGLEHRSACSVSLGVDPLRS
jgi:hypothetical protein